MWRTTKASSNSHLPRRYVTVHPPWCIFSRRIFLPRYQKYPLRWLPTVYRVEITTTLFTICVLCFTHYFVQFIWKLSLQYLVPQIYPQIKKKKIWILWLLSVRFVHKISFSSPQSTQNTTATHNKNLKPRTSLHSRDKEKSKEENSF